MSRREQMNEVMRHVWTEPKHVAWIEWSSDFSLGAQLMGQIPRVEAEYYAATGQHITPDREITLIRYEEPDWDWWEPTSEWRRQAAREREHKARMEWLA